jgi:hypothetical protein
MPADPNLQDITNTLNRIANNDLPHIQQRLTQIDVQIGVIQTHLGWQGKLLIILFTVALSLLIGIGVDAFI